MDFNGFNARLSGLNDWYLMYLLKHSWNNLGHFYIYFLYIYFKQCIKIRKIYK